MKKIFAGLALFLGLSANFTFAQKSVVGCIFTTKISNTCGVGAVDTMLVKVVSKPEFQRLWSDAKIESVNIFADSIAVSCSSVFDRCIFFRIASKKTTKPLIFRVSGYGHPLSGMWGALKESFQGVKDHLRRQENAAVEGDPNYLHVH